MACLGELRAYDVLTMTAQHLAADEPFFRQWSTRDNLPRTLISSKTLIKLLDFTPPPSIAVVGSKGKGTTLAALSVGISLEGFNAVSIMSPPFRTNRERIRLNGTAIDQDTYHQISDRLAELLPYLPADHYLSPAGAYTVMGAWWASQIGADVLVVEEGMGGGTDEVSLFSHIALGVTPIFFEHGGILGNTVPEIARNLISAGSSSVKIIASAPQSEDVANIMTASAEQWGAHVLTPPPASHLNPLIGQSVGLGAGLAKAVTPLLTSTKHGLHSDTCRKISGQSESLTHSPGAGNALAEPHELQPDLVGILNLPGRSSQHVLSSPKDHVTDIHRGKDVALGTGTDCRVGSRPVAGKGGGTWFVDAAITPDAVRAALQAADMPEATVVCCWPLTKDRNGCLELVPGAYEVKAGHGLPFAEGLPEFRDIVADLEEDVIALGTISFVGEVLDYLGAETDSWIGHNTQTGSCEPDILDINN